MTTLLVRALVGVGLLLAAAVAVVGGLALPASGIVALVLAGIVAACLGAGVVRESPAPTGRSVAEVAGQAAAWTMGVVLLLAGTTALAGGAVATLLAGVAAAVALTLWWRRASRAASRSGTRPIRLSGAPLDGPSGAGTPSPAHPAALWAAAREPGTAAPPRLPPVAALDTEALGRDWLRTSAALAGRLDPVTRQTLVQRRRQTLDELERRDPDGFARWLAEGPLPGSDPARYVQEDPTAGTDAA